MEKLIIKSDIIIYEVPMNNKSVFEAVDQTFWCIMCFSDPNSVEKIFGRI